MYDDDASLGMRLVIPPSLEKRIFEQAHDNLGHLGYHRAHERIVQNFFVFSLSRKLRQYIEHCQVC